MTKDIDRDEQVLTFRDEGRSFASVALILGLGSAGAANAAFNRALRCHRMAEQAWLRSHEAARLDASATRLHGRDDLSVEEVVRQLRALKHQRQNLFVA